MDPLIERFRSVVSTACEFRKSAVTTENSLIFWVCQEIARQRGALVVGTLDMSEILLGYFPKSVDQGDLMPIGGLFRTEVRALGKDFGYIFDEAIRVVPGCGSIIDYVEEKTEIRFFSEVDIDLALIDLLNGQSTEGAAILESLVRQNSYKSREVFWGKPLFYPETRRKEAVRSFLGDH